MRFALFSHTATAAKIWLVYKCSEKCARQTVVASLDANYRIAWTIIIWWLSVQYVIILELLGIRAATAALMVGTQRPSLTKYQK